MFAPLLVGSALAGAATVGGLVQHYRRQLGPMTLADVRALSSLEPTPIALCREGLVKIVGTLGSDAPERSLYNDTLVAVREVRHYAIEGRGAAATRVLSRVDRSTSPFWVEDDSGRISLDPLTARIDYEPDEADAEPMLEELRLRMGERVVVLGEARREVTVSHHPMRRSAVQTERGLHFVTAPLVTWRTEPEVYPKLLPPAGSAALSASTVALAVLGAILRL
jgi:hypothetical protein